MKTKFFAKTIALGALVWLFFASTQVKAQIMNPYTFMNNTPNCIVTIQYTIFSWTPMGCTNICGGGTIAVPPGPPTTIPITAGCDCGIQIDIIDVNGTPITPPITAGCNIPPIQPHGQGPDPSGCFPSGQIMFDVHPHGTDIHP
jgi:hypothetical protein